jgi:hypothetical protein
MKNACAHTFANDNKYKLRDRCVQLMKKWKVILLAGAAEEKASEEKKVAEREHNANPTEKAGVATMPVSSENLKDEVAQKLAVEQAVEPSVPTTDLHTVKPPQPIVPEQVIQPPQKDHTEIQQASITKEVEMHDVSTDGLLRESTLKIEQPTSTTTDVHGKDTATKQHVVKAADSNPSIDTIMEEASNGNVPSAVVAEAPTSMDLATETALDVLESSTT